MTDEGAPFLSRGKARLAVPVLVSGVHSLRVVEGAVFFSLSLFPFPSFSCFSFFFCSFHFPSFHPVFFLDLSVFFFFFSFPSFSVALLSFDISFFLSLSLPLFLLSRFFLFLSFPFLLPYTLPRSFCFFLLSFPSFSVPLLSFDISFFNSFFSAVLCSFPVS